jgi:hypothetical protein
MGADERQAPLNSYRKRLVLEMKRDSKGKIVKTFKAYIPRSDLTTVETQVSVYFKADTGMFTIYDGPHMYPAVQGRINLKANDVRIGDTYITSQRLNAITQAFDDICVKYTNEMRELQKRKVIRFTFKRNTPWDKESDRPAADDIHFCGTPAIHFTYEVLYRVGDTLYEKPDDDINLQYRGSATEGRFRDGDAITVDWTEEREKFFNNMQASLLTLIHRVDDFQKNLLTNVDRAIAGGALLLEKPK